MKPKSKVKRRNKMGKQTGEIDWDDADFGGNDYMRLEEGPNPVRIFTKPHQFYVVWTKDATGQTRKVHTPVENCPLVKRGDKPQAKWFIGVINRKNGFNKPCILEIGPQIYKQILGLKNKKAWGDPRAYDIDIERRPKGEQPLYVVSPEPKSPLTDEEKAELHGFMERTDFAQLTAAPTPEQIMQDLGFSSGDDEFGGDLGDSSSDDEFDFSQI